jgi:regulator of nucleoside diphosphate kinase
MNNNICLTNFDWVRINKLFSLYIYRDDEAGKNQKKLKDKLHVASITHPEAIEPDVITMNSKIRFKNNNDGTEHIFTLVFPHEANIDESKISIFSPVGIALLGARVGDILQCETPTGEIEIDVEEILFQPEASGYYYL